MLKYSTGPNVQWTTKIIITSLHNGIYKNHRILHIFSMSWQWFSLDKENHNYSTSKNNYVFTNNILYWFLKIENCLFSCSRSLLLCSTEYRKSKSIFFVQVLSYLFTDICTVSKLKRRQICLVWQQLRLFLVQLMALLFFVQLYQFTFSVLLHEENEDKPQLYSLHVSIQILL
jgi:hypothetical protein